MADESVETVVPVVNTDTPPASTPGADTSAPDPVELSRKAQERIDKLTRERHEDRWARESAERRVRELETQIEESKKPKVSDKPPTRAENDYDEAKYEAALTEYLTKVAEKKAEDALEKHSQQTTQQQKQSAFLKRQDDFIKSNPDYVEKVLERTHLPITNELQDELKQMDDGPDIAFHLCNNEEKARQIMSLPFVQQLREIGRIQAQLEAKKAPPPPPPKLSEAPPPVPKIEASDPAIKKAWNDPEISQADFNKRRAQQIAQRK